MHDALERWAAAGQGLLPEGAAEAVARTLATPARTVVVGLVGVGKTTLVNRWCGTEHPTGLGGVTAAPVTAPGVGFEVVDTPGIDRPEEALLQLQPLLQQADGVMWVVDGLQPLRASERRVLAEACPEEIPITALVARADLLGEEVHQVLARVEAHVGPRLAAPPEAVDVRTGPLPPPLAGPSSRIRRIVAQRVEALLQELPQAQPRQDETVRRARDRVRALVDQLVQDLHAGRLAQKVDARLAFRAQGPAVLDDLLPAVKLPAPAPVPHGARARALGSLSGLEGAERLLRADAAAWLVEVQLAIAEAYESHPGWAGAAARREALEDATRGLLAALGRAVSPREPRRGPGAAGRG